MLRLLKIILITIHLFSMQGEIAETLYFMVSPVGRRVCTFDDLLPCIEKITLLSEVEDRIKHVTSRETDKWRWASQKISFPRNEIGFIVSADPSKSVVLHSRSFCIFIFVN